MKNNDGSFNAAIDADMETVELGRMIVFVPIGEGRPNREYHWDSADVIARYASFTFLCQIVHHGIFHGTNCPKATQIVFMVCGRSGNEFIYLAGAGAVIFTRI